MIFAQVIPTSDNIWGFLCLVVILLFQMWSIQQNRTLIKGQTKARKKQDTLHDQVSKIVTNKTKAEEQIDILK